MVYILIYSQSIPIVPQAEGLKIAKEKGKHLGRPKAEYPTNWEHLYEEWKNEKITAKAAMEQLDLKRTTFYKLINKFENERV